MTERYPGKRSEYGGGDGLVQRTADGSSVDLPGIASEPGTRAMLMRKAGMNDFDPSSSDFVGLALTTADVTKMSAAELEAYEADVRESLRRAAERERLMIETNGYIGESDQYTGEDVSGAGGGVEAFGEGGASEVSS